MSIGSGAIGSGAIGASDGGGTNPLDVTVVETLGLNMLSLCGKAYPADLSETIRVELADDVVRGYVVTLTEELALSPSLVAAYGQVVTESLNLAEVLIANQVGQVTVSDALRFSEALLPAMPVALTETVALQLVDQVSYLLTVVEDLGLEGVLEGNAKYGITVIQALRLIDSLANFVGVDVTEGLGLGDVLDARKLAMAGIIETLGLAEDIQPRMLLSAEVTEELELSATELVSMLWSADLAETIQISGGILEPDGSISTWVMNARNSAVTEYQNYNFNSFAKLGNRYVGFSETGVYELLGDKDAGTDIIATLRGGFLQFGGTHLSRLKEAYIAARGDGDFVLKIITGDGSNYIYTVSAESMKNAKFHMGKGQRTRYFAYELTSTGQDFDLDTLEFVPVVVQRRV